MSSEGQPKIKWRTRLGFAIFLLSIGWPVLVPILPLLGASAETTAAFVGFMIVAAEIMLIGGAAVAGKDGFALIKAKVFEFLKTYGPPRKVGKRRYSIGLAMFTGSLAFGWASPYIGHRLPGFADGRMFYAIAGDVLLLVSLFVLGGGFWDKLRSLFQHDAYAVTPGDTASKKQFEVDSGSSN